MRRLSSGSEQSIGDKVGIDQRGLNRQLKTYYQNKSDTAIRDGGTTAYKKCGIVLVDDPSIPKEEE